MITSIIIRNVEPDIDKLKLHLDGLIGRGVSGACFAGMIIDDIRCITPFWRISGNVDYLIIVHLTHDPESEAGDV